MRPFVIVVLIVSGLCLPPGAVAAFGTESTQPRLGPVVQLPIDSPKHSAVQEQVVTLQPKPLLEPIAARVSYDEARTARVSSPIKGRIVSELKPLGAHVSSGDDLIVLDSPDLADAESDYDKAQANLRLAQKAYERAMVLYKGMAAPRKDVEQAADDLANARSEATRTRQRLANLNAIEKRNDDRFVLRAPVSGSIIERNVSPGLEVRPDMDQPLYVIADLRRVWVLMEVFEKDLMQVRAGQTVAVKVPAYATLTFTGTVDYVGQEVDETTRTVKVRCVVPNDNSKLLPGMYATVELLSSNDDKGLIVPSQALFTDGEADSLYVKVGVGQYQRRTVTVGLRLRDRVVIEAGLAAGETIVSAGALVLRAEEKISADVRQ